MCFISYFLKGNSALIYVTDLCFCPRMNFPLAGCLLAMNFPLRWLFFANDFSLACCLFCNEFCPHLLFFGNEFPPRLLFFGNEFPTRLLFFGNDFCLDPFRSPETQPVRLTWLWPTTISIRLYVQCTLYIAQPKSQWGKVKQMLSVCGTRIRA